MLLGIIILFSTAKVENQTDWLGGPGVLGPVQKWGNQFYTSENITYNIQGQITPVANEWDYEAWTKHIIDQNNDISGWSGIFPADFDGDGDMDLAGWIGGNTDEMRIYKNEIIETGNRNFTHVSTIYGAASSDVNCPLIWCGNINSDTLPDIVMAADGLWWFENKGNFNFELHQIDNNSNVDYSAVVTGDIDNDGDTDIIVGWRMNGSTSSLDLYRQEEDLTFTKVHIANRDNWRVLLGDLNNDGYLDLLAAGHVYLNNHGSIDGTRDWNPPLGGIDGISIQDFDNDGDLDLLIGHQWASFEPIYWYENHGTGTNYTQHLIYKNSDEDEKTWGDAAHATDIDMDGLPDVVSGLNKIGYFRQVSPGNFETFVVDDNFGNSHWIWAENLDRTKGVCGLYDNDVDIIASSSSRHEFAWWENDMMKGFSDNAQLESSILDAGETVQWYWFGWEACVPDNCSIKFYVRASDNPSDMGTYEGPISVSQGGIYRDSVDLSSYPVTGRYFQYKVEMEGEDYAPAVYEVFSIYGVDVGATDVTEPGACIDGDPITPSCIVTNFSDIEVTTTVVCEVEVSGLGVVWDDATQVTLGPEESKNVVFGTYTPVAAKTHTFRFYTTHELDVETSNDVVEAEIDICTGLGDDFGDAPDPPYATSLKNNGARHSAPIGDTHEWLGDINRFYTYGCEPDSAQVDPEFDTWGEDKDSPFTNVGPDDGIKFYYPYEPGKVCSLDILVSTKGEKERYEDNQPLKLQAWIDWSRDGSWDDENEFIQWLSVKKISPDEGEEESIDTNTVTFDPTTWSSPCQVFRLKFKCYAPEDKMETWGRFRLTHTLAPNSPIGDASAGEVEDYKILIGEEGIKDERRVQRGNILRILQNFSDKSTQIEYVVKERSVVNLTIYDNTGRIIKKLLCGCKVLEPGTYKVRWDGKDGTGRDVSSGVYYVVLKVRGKVESTKVVIVK